MTRLRTEGILATIFLGTLLAGVPLGSQNSSTPQNTANDEKTAVGRQIFATYCSGCHGLDGSGTQRAPSLGAGSNLDRLAPEEIRRIISEGIPEMGMPAFRAFGQDKLGSILAYLDRLRGKDVTSTLPGNPDNGRQLFFGSAGCSSCHAVAGNGGFIAPDLSSYASNHSPEITKAAITDASKRDSALPLVVVTTAEGRKYRGVVRNEDNFSIQIQVLDGGFRFFSKSRVRHIDRETQSLMPSDYAQKLTPAQMDDLVSYLASVGARARVPVTKENDDEQ